MPFISLVLGLQASAVAERSKLQKREAELERAVEALQQKLERAGGELGDAVAEGRRLEEELETTRHSAKHCKENWERYVTTR